MLKKFNLFNISLTIIILFFFFYVIFTNKISSIEQSMFTILVHIYFLFFILDFFLFLSAIKNKKNKNYEIILFILKLILLGCVLQVYSNYEYFFPSFLSNKFNLIFGLKYQFYTLEEYYLFKALKLHMFYTISALDIQTILVDKNSYITTSTIELYCTQNSISFSEIKSLSEHLLKLR